MKNIKLATVLFLATVGVAVFGSSQNVEAARSNTRVVVRENSLEQRKVEGEKELVKWRDAGVLETEIYSSISYMLSITTSVSQYEFYFNQFHAAYEPLYQATLSIEEVKANAYNEIAIMESTGKIVAGEGNIFRQCVSTCRTAADVEFLMSQFRGIAGQR